MPDSTETRALLLQISANTELLRSNLSEAEKAIASFHSDTVKHLDDSDKRFALFGKSIESLEAPLEHLKRVGEGAFAFLIGESLITKGKEALEFAGNIEFMAKQIGVSTDFLQKYRYAAGQFGVGTQEADTGLTKLTRSIGSAANGNKEMVELFNRLGVNVLDSSGKVRSTEAIYPELADAIAKVDSPAQRLIDTVTLMGRGSAAMAPMLAQGADGFNTLAQAAQQLGVVLSPELIEHSEEVNHKLGALKQVVDAQMASAIATNAVQIESLATALIHAAAATSRFLSAHPQEAGAILGAMAGARVGGLPGAAIGALAGAGVAGFAQHNADEANNDLAFRREQLHNAVVELNNIKARDGTDTVKVTARGEMTTPYAGAYQDVMHQRELMRRAMAAPKPVESGLGSDAPGATNDNGSGLKKAQDELADLEKHKARASGAALTAYNEEIATKKRQIAFMREGASAEMASTLAGKEGAAVKKGESDAAKATRKAEQEREKAIQDDLAYRSQELALRKKLVEGARASTTNDVARDALEKQEINAEADNLRATILDRLSKGGYGVDASGKPTPLARARATELLGMNEYVRSQNLGNVDLSAAARDQKNAADKASLDLQGQIDLLGLTDRLALTRRARLAAELKLLELNEQLAIKAQQDIIDSKDPKVTPTQRADAQTRIDQLRAEYPSKVEQVRRDNGGPLDAYKQQLQTSVGDTNEALQGLEVSGLQNLESAFEGILTGSKSVSSAIKSMVSSIIADLAKLAVEKAFFSLLKIGGGGGSLFSSSGWDSGMTWTDGMAPGHADGGQIKGPGTSTSDSIIARLSTGEFIMNAKSTQAYLPLLHAMNDNHRMSGFATGGFVGSSPSAAYPRISTADYRRLAVPRFEVTAAPNPYFDVHVSQVANRLDQQAAPRVAAAGSQLAQRDLGRMRRRALG